MAYKVTISQNGKQTDITKLCGVVSWRSNIDGLSTECNIDLVQNPNDRFITDVDIQPGDKLYVAGENAMVFFGIVVDSSFNNLNRKSITAYDYGFYLNQNEVIIQFNNTPADTAIKQLMNKLNIKVGKIPSMSTKIKKIYKGETVSDVLKDILDQVFKEKALKYRFRVDKNELLIENYYDNPIKAYFKPSTNLNGFDIIKAIGNISGSKNIVDLRNSVVIASNDDDNTRVYSEVSDSKSIGAYGKLQKVETIDGKDSAQAKNIANNLLKELNKVGETLNVELLGADNVNAGVVLELDQKELNIKGKYLVLNADHRLESGLHTMQLELEAVK